MITTGGFSPEYSWGRERGGVGDEGCFEICKLLILKLHQFLQAFICQLFGGKGERPQTCNCTSLLSRLDLVIKSQFLKQDTLFFFWKSDNTVVNFS